MNNELEININNFKYNFYKIKELLNNAEIIPILKDNAYMTYLNKEISILNELEIKIIGLATVDEGEEMRNLGFSNEIFILNHPFEEEIEKIAKNNLTIGCGSIEFLSKLGSYPANFNIHIEICTGMGRTGIRPDTINDYILEAKKYSNIKITGIYTHFSCSDSDEEFTKKQLAIFNEVVTIAKNNIPSLKYIHASNSAGIVNFQDSHFNLVRPGIILYGYYPNDELKKVIDLKPVARLKSKISFLKEVPTGTPISYGKTFITSRPSKIATVSIGYSSGVRRALSNKGNVVINGKIAPIVGTICMDEFMVDVTDIEAKVNDDVFIFDNEKVTLDDVANICDTINYEILTGISHKVKRVFLPS